MNQEKSQKQPEQARSLKSWLLKRADNHRANLMLLIIGAGIFFSGVGIVFWADTYMPVSMKQELAGLGGMVLVAGGGLTALIGYLGLSILRLFRFFNDDP